jgi:Uma2 family endonuclease
VTRPEFKHHAIQGRLRDLLKSLAPPGAYVEYEAAFRALPEYELRIADAAYLPAERLDEVDPDDNIGGAPDLVVEVLSPSNTAAELNDKEKLCLENGARQFWVVDPNLRQVKVSTPDGITTTYRPGQEIPLRLFGGGSLKAGDIFA